MANKNEYKAFRYYEGLCSSDDFPKEIAKVLSLGVNQNGIPLPTKNWEIIYPTVEGDEELDYVSKINARVNKITDTVILKTKTTPVDESDDDVDNLAVDPDSRVAYKEMYLEIYKPTYIADPESYPLDCERKGITPLLITKELWENKFNTHHQLEETLDDTFEASRVTIPVIKDSKTYTVKNSEPDMSYDDTYNFVQKLSEATGTGIPAPGTNDINVSIERAVLSKIKQENPDVYTFIADKLSGTSYSLIDSVLVQIIRTGTDPETSNGIYQINIEATVNIVNYTIKKNTTFTLKKSPNTTIVPELYRDGIYIPIPNSYYTVTDTKIKFVENYEYEKYQNGMLVVRYEYISNAENLITDRVTLKNNHYVLMRLFDVLNEAGDGPADNVYDVEGNIVKTNSHVSPWSKLSWYVDFEELLLDTLDEDASTSTISDGSVFVPLETPGLSGDTKIQYWLNTNNDRFSLIVMGNASLDYTRERHLISSCYCGVIDSFEDSITDVSGNFALYTSSSTEPCSTELKANITNVPAVDYVLSESDIGGITIDDPDFVSFKNNVPYSGPANGTTTYYVDMTEDNQFIDTSVWPKYMFINSAGLPVTGLVSAEDRSYIMENGRATAMQLTVRQNDYDSNYTILVNYSYYIEKYVITSGVTRDVFGNVINVRKDNTYGPNTSDGVTSISMYHSRSKAYYQKHQMLFATTEEYMSKVMYGKSKYTGEYYADRIKVTHGNDGPRGILGDVLVIDSASLYPLDELVINKDFKKDKYENEETFVYFPVTAPYSPLSDGPNARYGLAIKKCETEPRYEDEKDMIDKVISYIKTTYGDNIFKDARNDINKVLQDSSVIPVVDINGEYAKVYWRVVENTNKEYNSETGEYDISMGNYYPVKILVPMTDDLKGDFSDPAKLVTVGNVVIDTEDSTPQYEMTTSTSTIYLLGYTQENDTILAYGIADESEYIPSTDKLGFNSQLKVVVNDECETNPETWEYGIDGVAYSEDIELLEDDKIVIRDPIPGKILLVYEYEIDDSGSSNKYNILKCSKIKLTQQNTAYPSTVNATVISGLGQVGLDNVEEKASITRQLPYKQGFTLKIVPDTGYTISSVTLSKDDGEPEELTGWEAAETGYTLEVDGSKIDALDIKIRVYFAKASNN